MSRVGEFLIRGPFSLFVLLHLSANGKTQTEQEGKQPLFVEHKITLLKRREKKVLNKRPK